jgi:predicted nucleic acid-binding Zn ribbon protein
MGSALAGAGARTYGGISPPVTAVMSKQRYRITVTPIETDGRPCSGRCTIEFEQKSQQNWMRQLETLQRQRDLSGDECAAFTVGTALLKELAEQPRAHAHDTLARLRPELQALLEQLERIQRPH